MKVVIVNGAAASGKDTFVSFCESALGSGVSVTKTSMVDAAKDAARYLGWDEQKTLKNRKFLSNLKDLIDEWGDVSYKWVKDNIIDQEYEESIACGDKEQPWVFVMAREPDDIDRLKKNLNASSVCIRRKEAEDAPTSNHADACVLMANYDYYIDNNGTIEGLKEAAETLVKIVKENEFTYVRSN